MAYQALGTHFDQDLPAEAKREVERYQAEWAKAKASGDQAGMDAAHAAAERIRANYGYSGGVDGSDKISMGTVQVDKPAQPELSEKPEWSFDAERPTYSGVKTERPSYVSPYAEQIDSTLDGILNREAFSYDYQTDPLYGVYSQIYQREGQRATEDALGNAALLSGGMPSSAALTAATQAGDYYAAKQADIIPQLQQQAYEMYMQDLVQQRNDLSNLMSAENLSYGQHRDAVYDWESDRAFDYGQYRDAVSDWENDRNFSYGQYRDDMYDWESQRNYDYNAYRDSVSDAQWQESMDYQRLQDALSRNDMAEATEYEKALYRAELLASAGDFSGFAALGYTPEQIASLQASLVSTPSYSSGYGYGGGAGTDAELDSSLGAMFQAMKDSGSPDAYWLQNFSKYGYKNDDALDVVMDNYEKWLSDNSIPLPPGSSSGGTFLEQQMSNDQLEMLFQQAQRTAGSEAEAWQIFLNAAYDLGASPADVQKFKDRL